MKNELTFQHDGAPLCPLCGQGPEEWPPRSPDLIPQNPKSPVLLEKS